MFSISKRMFSLHGHHYSTRYQIPLDVVMSMLSGFGSAFRLQNHSVHFSSNSQRYKEVTVVYRCAFRKVYTVVTKNWDTACKIVFVTRLRLVTVPRSPAWRTAAHSAPTNSIGEKSFYTAVLLPFFAVIADPIQDWRYRPIKSG